MHITRHDSDLDSALGLIQGNHATNTGIHLGDSSWAGDSSWGMGWGFITGLTMVTW